MSDRSWPEEDTVEKLSFVNGFEWLFFAPSWLKWPLGMERNEEC